jgi:hypothetical protein
MSTTETLEEWLKRHDVANILEELQNEGCSTVADLVKARLTDADLQEFGATQLFPCRGVLDALDKLRRSRSRSSSSSPGGGMPRSRSSSSEGGLRANVDAGEAELVVLRAKSVKAKAAQAKAAKAKAPSAAAAAAVAGSPAAATVAALENGSLVVPADPGSRGGRGLGARGLGMGGAKRHRKVLRDNILGVTKLPLDSSS